MYLIGQGVDTHQLKKCKCKTTIGGYSFNSNWKVIAHSDGDVVLHSISNAILGALQLGDIGEYFSDQEIKNRGLDSKKIIEFCLNKMNQRKFKIVNVDLTITCENIMFNKIKHNIVKLLQTILKTKLVNVKATRFETKSNLIKCDSVVLISK